VTGALGRPPGGDRDRVRLTSRAAVLAVVICAIALSLAYPVREYIAQRRQIDQLQAERQMLNGQLRALQHQQQRLGDPAYIEQLARNRLHMCLRGETCYVVIGGHAAHPGAASTAAALTPWYERLWRSVQEANRGSPR
jgi:cell division protein FtsL